MLYLGTGELLYVNGDKFRGEWLDDKAHGIGTLEYANGDVYEGAWIRDQRHGDWLREFGSSVWLDCSGSL